MLSFKFIKHYSLFAALSGIIVFAVLESQGVLIFKALLFMILTFIVIFLLGLYLGFKTQQNDKHRLSAIASFIRVLSNGKLSDRIQVSESGELASIERSLNQLADRYEQQVQNLQRLADEKAELAEQAKSAATIEERQRLARDLHDAVSQQLFALNMLASAAKKAVVKKPEMAEQQIAEIAEIALKAQGEMRALLLHLRPVHLSEDSLQEGMEKLIYELGAKTNIQFETEIHIIKGLSKGVEDHLFRLLQEALSNALRHSQASVIKLELTQTSQAVVMKVHDNGKGFDLTEDKKTSYGLKTMRERCEELGGKLTLTSRPNEGTFVDIRIPLKSGGGNSQ
ncbi:NarL family two-component system sensor histidine kinase LiaS [Pullulanibacillus pueri]|uniref:Sensor histidine kinase n=1 Tax=Pullulanibacillus pueri TaxID=1437324 RepID=A0A8J2ZZD9_9BACL|nr:sensor histidine kinase [Pullulanibacillus pueri]MBM7683438.1 NarL family two-component system sensor histidine kinase LiaS [Pullulanibacillus pueri]GGH87402.1 sensor histidine kinase [Pullulanibacillus pueri]